MANIDTVVSPTLAQEPQMSPQAAGAGWGAVAAGANQASQTAMFGLKVGNAIQKASDHVQTLKAENDLRHDVNLILEEAQQKTDYANFEEWMDGKKNEITEKYANGLGNNPRIWNAFEPHMGASLEAASHAVRMHGLKLMTDEGKVELYKDLQNYSQRRAAASDDQTKAEVDAQAMAKIDLLKNDGIFTAHEAYATAQHYMVSSEETEVLGGLKSKDPNVIQGTLDKIANHKYKTLEGSKPEWLESQKMMAEGRLAVKKDALEVSRVVTAISDLFPKNGDEEFNREKIMKAAEQQTGDPTTLKHVREEIKRIEGDHEDAKKKKFESRSGAILLKGQDDWSKERVTSVNAIKAMPEYQDLTKAEQSKVLDKVIAENFRITSEKRSAAAAARGAKAAERSAAAAEDQAREKKFAARYNDVIENVGGLAAMKEDEVNALRVELGEKQFKAVKKEWQYLQTGAGKIFIADLRTKTIKRAVEDLGITDPVEKSRIYDLVKDAVGDEKDAAKVKQKSIEALQHVWKTEKGFFGGETRVLKTKEEMRKEKKNERNVTRTGKDASGRKVVQYSDGAIEYADR